MKTTFESRRGAAAAHGGSHLLDDLALAQLPLEAGLPGGAELAGHGAAGLGGDAHRHPVGIVHQHGLDPCTVVQRPEPLGGLARVGALAGMLGERGGHGVGQRTPEGRRQLGHLLGTAHPGVEAVPDLADPVGRFSFEEPSQLVLGHVIGRRLRHHPRLGGAAVAADALAVLA